MTDRTRLPKDFRGLARKPGTYRQSSLPPFAGVPDTDSQVGVGVKSSAGSGGIASPLVEPDAATRDYYPAQDIVLSDGTLVTRLPIRVLNMVDANGRAVVFEFAEPDPTKL